MKEIELTQGKFALCDDEDYEWLNQFKWYPLKGAKTYYAIRIIHQNRQTTKTVQMHREILNYPKGLDIDHQDDDGLNNQRYNLKICTRQENQMKRRPYIGTSSIYKGVCYKKLNKYKKWQSRIKHNQKEIYLGCFISETEAALAYNKAATELFGEFARLNIIEGLNG